MAQQTIELSTHYLNTPDEIESSSLSDNNQTVPTCKVVQDAISGAISSLYINSENDLIDKLNEIVIEMNKIE